VAGTATGTVGGVTRSLGGVVAVGPPTPAVPWIAPRGVVPASWLAGPPVEVAVPAVAGSPVGASTGQAEGGRGRAGSAAGASLADSRAADGAGGRPASGVGPSWAASGTLSPVQEPGVGQAGARPGRPSPPPPGLPGAPAAGSSSPSPSGQGGWLLLAILAVLLVPPALVLLGRLWPGWAGGRSRSYRPALLPG
jgi:hypothetical protein